MITDKVVAETIKYYAPELVKLVQREELMILLEYCQKIRDLGKPMSPEEDLLIGEATYKILKFCAENNRMVFSYVNPNV